MIDRTSRHTAPGRPARVIAAGATALTAALAGAAFATTEAQALVVSSDANGLQMREPDNILNRVKLSLVDAGGLKYRVEMAQFGGRGIGFGPGCAQASTTPGLDIALCTRVTPIVSQVSLGPMRDTFDADPSFPDPIVINDGGIGPDIFRLGAGNDVSRADREDSVFGLLGNDDLTSTGGRIEGGEGNDKLNALTGSNNRMVGGAGDDVLTADKKASGRMTGGEGTDSFDAGGGRFAIEARDGVKEQVSCGKPSPSVRRGVAIIDLVDTPSDAALVAGGCQLVDRAPEGEKTAAQLKSTSLKRRAGMVGVRVRCTTSKRCKGTLSVTVKGTKRSKTFSIKGKRTGIIRLKASLGTATVRIKEKGKEGARTTRASLKVRS